MISTSSISLTGTRSVTSTRRGSVERFRQVHADLAADLLRPDHAHGLARLGLLPPHPDAVVGAEADLVHALAINGVFETTGDGTVRVHEAPPPSNADVVEEAPRVRDRTLRWLRRHNCLDERAAEDRSNAPVEPSALGARSSRSPAARSSPSPATPPGSRRTLGSRRRSRGRCRRAGWGGRGEGARRVSRPERRRGKSAPEGPPDRSTTSPTWGLTRAKGLAFPIPLAAGRAPARRLDRDAPLHRGLTGAKS